ncbi:MAG: hypothetical protein K6G11_08070 [Lachnospiraceae bacterium]|nr:hypothetical protein [Lachnospiraceae bacterium]
MQKNQFRNNILKFNIFLFSFILAFSLTGCKTKTPSEEEATKYIKSIVKGEKITFDEESENHFKYHSENRDLSFEVWTESETASIFGKTFNIPGTFKYQTDYLDKINEFYDDEVNKYLNKYGFTSRIKSSDCSYLRNFTFCINEEYTPKDVSHINSFLYDLQTIANSETHYHTYPFTQIWPLYNVKIIWEEDGRYIKSKGFNKSNFTTNIYAGTTEINIYNLNKAKKRQLNVKPPEKNGELIYIPIQK